MPLPSTFYTEKIKVKFAEIHELFDFDFFASKSFDLSFNCDFCKLFDFDIDFDFKSNNSFDLTWTLTFVKYQWLLQLTTYRKLFMVHLVFSWPMTSRRL